MNAIPGLYRYADEELQTRQASAAPPARQVDALAPCRGIAGAVALSLVFWAGLLAFLL